MLRSRPRTIEGRDIHGPSHAFDSGSFAGTPVYLGELRTDGEGHLVVLGGRGVAASSSEARAVTFANNEDWYDDVSDGPVTATVRFEGKSLRVDPAWVVVVSPNYAPAQKSVRTMYELLTDVFITAGSLPSPVRPSFQHDIRP
ncbi:MAG: LodA/GoxA family CTQ-dependent oxidase, partial [Actinomycetota bacterium]|nr:LodA/GoxA family CTQ-dependent oxidase [Actinomycetota bacterium]